MMQLILSLFSLLTLAAAQSSSSNTTTEPHSNNTLTCFDHVPVNSTNAMTTSDATLAIADFCKKAKGTFSEENTGLFQAIAFLIPNVNASMTDTPIGVSAKWVQIPNTQCPQFTFNTTNLDRCEAILGYILGNCQTVKHNPEPYWKQGGTYLDNCILWTLAPNAHYNGTNYAASIAAPSAGHMSGAFALVAALLVAAFIF